MKKTGVLLIAAAATLLVSCTFDWPSGNNDLTEDTSSYTSTTETDATVEKVSSFKDEVLQSYEVRYIGDTDARTIDQVQYYSASGALKGSWVYARAASGLVERAAYFDAESDLRYYNVYDYDDAGAVSAQYEYDGESVLQSARLYKKADSGLSAGQLETVAVFGPDATLQGGLQYYFLETSKTWNMEVALGSASSSLSGGITALNPTAGADSVDIAAETKLELTVPDLPTLPELAIPDFDALSASGQIAVSGYRFSYDDAYGNTLVALNQGWLPQSGSRKDTRLAETISVELGYDDESRIVSKSTYYGSTLALKVVVTYATTADGSISYIPVKVETTGAAMLLPLTYVIDYGPSHEVTALNVFSNDVQIRKLAYTYNGPVVPTTIEGLKSMDPFAFLSELLKSDIVIYDYDGDGKLIETFTPAVLYDYPGDATIPTGVRVDVHAAKADGSDGGDFTGAYTVAYDTAGNSVSLKSTDAAGNLVWTQETGNLSDIVASLESVAPDVVAQASNLGSLVETWVPKDAQATASTVVSEIQSSFMYNLLF